MTALRAYLPLLLFCAAVAAALFATASDRAAQLHAARAALQNLRGKIAHAKFLRMRMRRVVFYLLLLYLLGYITAYQRAQHAIADALTARGVEGVTVGSLIIPHSAFFRSAYTADAGFSKSKRRARAEVAVRAGWFARPQVRIDESGMARIIELTGKKFVFSYLTDVKVLRPAIHAHMESLLRAKQIDKYEIETFDNRGPYILVALAESLRGESAAAAARIAQSVYAELTQVRKLKVNQVVVKAVEPAAYLAGRAAGVVARGTAGNY